MKLRIKDGVLVLIPENDQDKAEFTRALGPKRWDSHQNIEFTGDAYGKAINMVKDGSVEVKIHDAWWNYDD